MQWELTTKEDCRTLKIKSNILPGETKGGIFSYFIIMVDTYTFSKTENIIFFPTNEDYLAQQKVWVTILKEEIFPLLNGFKLCNYAQNNAYLWTVQA